MPSRALYYPEWTITEPVFMAEALLFWERVACIVPFPEFRFGDWLKQEDPQMRKVMEKAHEDFIFRLVPSDEQKMRTHERIRIFAENDLPDWCHPENLTPVNKETFSAYKFNPQTVELLREKGWITQYTKPNNLELQVIASAAADLVLGALVDECSSPTMPPVTDDPGSFTANCNFLLQELGAQSGLTLQATGSQNPSEPVESDYAFLLAEVPRLGIENKGCTPKTIERILHARENSDLNEQRRSFQAKVDHYLTQLRTAEGGEREMIRDEFIHELVSDRSRLEKNLRKAGIEAIVSKDGAVAILLGLVSGAFQPAIGIVIFLAGELFSYHHRRQEVFSKHWSSWMFSVENRRIHIW